MVIGDRKTVARNHGAVIDNPKVVAFNRGAVIDHRETVTHSRNLLGHDRATVTMRCASIRSGKAFHLGDECTNPSMIPRT